MAENTSIEWCDHTWSPWEGCTRVSIAKTGGGGCDNCYAERMNRWLHRGENWGPGAPRLEFSDDHWDKLLRWNAAAAKRGAQPKVFPSMCDPFDNEVRAGLRDRFWRAIENTPSLTWLVLTKRVGNAQKMLPQAWLKNGWPSNLWLGATVVNQAEADRDIPKLLAVPARVHFISYEPALGGIWIAKYLKTGCSRHGALDQDGKCEVCEGRGIWSIGEPLAEHEKAPTRPGISWVIAGGESGPHARPAHPDWFRSLRDQCAAAGVPFMFKQWGEWVPMMGHVHGVPVRGEKFKHDDGTYMGWAGKKAAGRLLDGREHNDFPSTT